MEKSARLLPRLAAAGAALLLIAAAEPAAPAPAADDMAAFQSLKLSAELARWGRAHNDAWALATAARLRRETPMELVRREGGDAEVRDVSETWLNEALALGQADPRLVSFVEDVRAVSFKGRQGGPKVSTGRLGAGLSHRFAEKFQPGKPSVVYIEGDGDTDLTLQVSAPSGAVACADSSPGDVKMCSWTASEGGGYAVEVLNRGRVENRYALATN